MADLIDKAMALVAMQEANSPTRWLRGSEVDEWREAEETLARWQRLFAGLYQATTYKEALGYDIEFTGMADKARRALAIRRELMARAVGRCERDGSPMVVVKEVPRER